MYGIIGINRELVFDVLTKCPDTGRKDTRQLVPVSISLFIDALSIWIRYCFCCQKGYSEPIVLAGLFVE